MAELNTTKRRKLPDKARAAQAVESGRRSKTEEGRIDGKADAVLKGH